MEFHVNHLPTRSSYQNDERVIMKGSVQYEVPYSHKLNSISGEIIVKTFLYNFDSLKPHFYIVKLGFTGVYLLFLFLLKNIDCGYSLELSQ